MDMVQCGTGKLASVKHKSFAAFDYVEMESQAIGDYNRKCSRCGSSRNKYTSFVQNTPAQRPENDILCNRNNVSDILGQSTRTLASSCMSYVPEALRHARCTQSGEPSIPDIPIASINRWWAI